MKLYLSLNYKKAVFIHKAENESEEENYKEKQEKAILLWVRPKICCSFENLFAESRAVNVNESTAKLSKKQQILDLISANGNIIQLSKFTISIWRFFHLFILDLTLPIAILFFMKVFHCSIGPMCEYRRSELSRPHI